MSTVEHLGVMPFSGAPREARNPDLKVLRMWSVPGFRNYSLLYVTPLGNVEIVRLFHGAQDIEADLEDEI